MSATFFPAAGCVYRPANGGSGAYKLSGLRSSAPTIITGAQVSDTDITLPVVCLNGKTLIYSFGRNFGEASVQGMALLGPGGSLDLSSLQSYVDSRRASGNGSQVYLSTPLGGFKVFVVGFGLGAPDSEYQIQPFVIYCKINP